MRAKIRAEKIGKQQYTMICILPTGKIEYPQEQYIHATKSDVYNAAYAMYHGDTWDYNQINHTIKID